MELQFNGNPLAKGAWSVTVFRSDSGGTDIDHQIYNVDNALKSIYDIVRSESPYFEGATWIDFIHIDTELRKSQLELDQCEGRPEPKISIRDIKNE